MGWAAARKKVQQACLDLLVQWRGDDEDDGKLEDILREVIVISDDEEDEEMRQDTKPTQRNSERSESVEVISANALKTLPINYAIEDTAVDQPRSPSLDIHGTSIEEYPDAVPLVSTRPVQYTQHRLEQIGAHRHKIWEEAVNRQRGHPKAMFGGNCPPPIPTFENPEYGRSNLSHRELPSTQLQLRGIERQERSPPTEKNRHPIALPVSEGQSTYRYGNRSQILSKYAKQVSALSQADRDGSVWLKAKVSGWRLDDTEYG